LQVQTADTRHLQIEKNQGIPVRAVQVGGPLGAYFPPALFDTAFDYEAFAAKGGMVGFTNAVTADMGGAARTDIGRGRVRDGRPDRFALRFRAAPGSDRLRVRGLAQRGPAGRRGRHRRLGPRVGGRPGARAVPVRPEVERGAAG